MLLTDIVPTVPRATRLVVSAPDFGKYGLDFWIWCRALQGLVNREEPHLYLIEDMLASDCSRPSPRDLYERHWLDYYVKTFGLPTEELHDADALLERYEHLVGGYILYDNEDIIQTQNVALTRAGLESLLPVSPDQEPWMARHGIPKRDDLRGRFASDADAAEWALDNLWPYCNKRLYANLCVHRPFRYALSHTLADFVSLHKVLALDLPLSRQSRRTLNLYRRMLESADPPGIQMNWHCVCDQEKEYVAEAAERGFFTLCSLATPNLSIHGAVGDPDAAYSQPLPERDLCRAQPDRVYVSLYVSDGDATWAMNNLHSGNWLAPQRGQFKLGWGMLPFMVKLMPAMVRYYNETRHRNDCFWGPSSGAGYTYSFLWPEDLVDGYLEESCRLLDQTGQHGCNMVDWLLRDWWREVEDDAGVRREQDKLQPSLGLVCGLGGSPYAKSYLDGPVPKLHSVHIANVRRDNIGDIVKLAQECPTRPLFLFLFVQIAAGVVEHLAAETPKLARHAEIELLSMDEFFLTLQDAIARGLVKAPMYEKTEALGERWLKAPGRHRLPLCERLTAELARVAHLETEERRRVLAEAGWAELVSREVEDLARDRDAFMTMFEGRAPIPSEEEADTLLYVAFTVAWTLVRAAIQSQGIYANHRTQCLKDFERTCGGLVDTQPFERLFASWGAWETGVPSVNETAAWCDGVAKAARVICDRLGPDQTEEFTGWPPRTI